MADSRRKQGGAFSSQAPLPPSAPPSDVVASCGHRPRVPETLTFHRLTGQGKLVKQPVCVPNGFTFLFPESALPPLL